MATRSTGMCPTETPELPASVGAPTRSGVLPRLDFVLPDFTRVAWVSDQAESTWAPRLARVSAAFAEIEWRAILAGVRSCAATLLSPEELVARTPTWSTHGLAALPLEICGTSDQPYSATGVPPEAGQPVAFRVVVGTPADVATFKAAWDAADQDAIGTLLGYPPCCREFFRRVWVDDAMLDTTWPMATATPAAVTTAPVGPATATVLDVSGPPQANILWRWMGVRPVPHLPCSLACPATVALADRFVAVGRATGYGPEMNWLLEILRWPVQWSALHGIAEIKTPVLKVSTRTDATPAEYVVRRAGESYPDEGATGLSFPYRQPVTLRIASSKGFRRGLEHATTQARPPWYARDNGFASIQAMRDAHQPILDAAATVLGDEPGAVLDLGCGNGALLAELQARRPTIQPFGVDFDATRIEHARTLHPHFADHFIVTDLFDDRVWDDTPRFALALLMPGRLLEIQGRRADALRDRLTRSCDQLLVYAYGDWLTHHGGLAPLAEAAGLHLVSALGPSVGLAEGLQPRTRTEPRDEP